MKAWIVLAVLLAVLFGLIVVGRLSGAWQWYSVPGASGEPNIKISTHIVATNLLQPKRLDLIVFWREPGGLGATPEGNVQVNRLCGVPGDTLLLKNGVLFVNGLNVDKDLNLMNEYLVSSPKLPEKTGDEPDDEFERYYQKLSDFLWHVNLPSEVAHRHGFRLWISNTPLIIEGFEDVWKMQDWNVDNMGPLVVPENKYFVLGDSRHNALDSRFFGYVDKTKWIGTVVPRGK